MYKEHGFPLRTHHLDYAFSMAASLQRAGKQNLVLSPTMKSLLYSDSNVEYDAYTPDDIEFLQFLTNLSYVFREKFTERFSSESKDYVGTDSKLLNSYIDAFVEASSKSVLAVFLPDTHIEIGDVLDGHCLSCASGNHCLDYKYDDLAILIQLNYFAERISAPTPDGATLEKERQDNVYTVSSNTVREFLYDRVDHPMIDNIKEEEGIVFLPTLYRIFLMARKRER